jgi:hypothetical protein
VAEEVRGGKKPVARPPQRDGEFASLLVMAFSHCPEQHNLPRPVGRRDRRVRTVFRQSSLPSRLYADAARATKVAGRPRAFASSSEERRFLDVLLAACTTGDLTSLERLLVSKIVPKSERASHSLSVGPRSSKWARSCRCSRGRRSSGGSARARRRQENSL